ncbi:adenylate kinase [Acidilobus sp. 7A]|uniref:adenylate kinase n=1 Tax=Acidilobus sp. 7A TaxID=1577685 RepID=UPI000764DB20|nr:adenylate kinase [Acidilobus sp. 7A]AMD30341.1 adenylate kinase [Acidilobus sp. 7A]
MSNVRRNEFKVVIVTGVPGVGKTTVLSLAQRKANERGLKLKVLNFGDYMLENAVKKGLLSNRDQIRYLSFRGQLELQAAAATAMVEEAGRELSERDFLMVDTHAVVKTPLGYLPGLPSHVITILKPDMIVLVEADPKEIAARQQRDSTRYRSDFGGEEGVREIIEMSRYAAIASAVEVGSLVTIIRNAEGKAGEAAEQLINMISKL